MNKAILIGRWTKDPDTKYAGDLCITTGSLAVDRKFKREGEPTADFPRVKAFGKTAESIDKYFCKGMKIAVTGHIQTGHYDDKEGKRVNTFEVIIDEWEFAEKKQGGGEIVQEGIADDDGFVDASGVPDAFLDF